MEGVNSALQPYYWSIVRVITKCVKTQNDLPLTMCYCIIVCKDDLWISEDDSRENVVFSRAVAGPLHVEGIEDQGYASTPSIL
jgi:hypothetical protein